MTGSPSPLAAQALFAGRFRSERRLGSGSLGTVYLAWDEQTSRHVALKVVRADRFSGESVQHLRREFRSIAVFRHPQIAAVYDFGYVEGSGFPYYTSEYIEGKPRRTAGALVRR